MVAARSCIDLRFGVAGVGQTYGLTSPAPERERSTTSQRRLQRGSDEPKPLSRREDLLELSMRGVDDQKQSIDVWVFA
jgi:hypothetical protein